MAVLPSRFFSHRTVAWDALRQLSAAIPTWRYRNWIARHDTLAERDRAAIRIHLAQLPRRPTISILIAGTGTAGIGGLNHSLRSLANQLYRDWEACVAADGVAMDAGD